MKLPQMISTIFAAITFGYLGSQYLSRNLMYLISVGMAGVGAVASVTPSKSQKKLESEFQQQQK
ncbi:hypothetical protein H6G97_50475 [Nostoc flagelliforme FACHB-838]|uniref:Uncharacterized protein n=2 Tax=Nostoc flagelliforme TaxID=1306274 RepID=A0ABR8E7B9_9NOSO|nr:hypothetical protein [Nostoc flagelliforme FACHB-838]